jgi:hypothetical protein
VKINDYQQLLDVKDVFSAAEIINVSLICTLLAEMAYNFFLKAFLGNVIFVLLPPFRVKMQGYR